MKTLRTGVSRIFGVSGQGRVPNNGSEGSGVCVNDTCKGDVLSYFFNLNNQVVAGVGTRNDHDVVPVTLIVNVDVGTNVNGHLIGLGGGSLLSVGLTAIQVAQPWRFSTEP